MHWRFFRTRDWKVALQEAIDFYVAGVLKSRDRRTG
jgi:hypothetical protein